jgi:uncharacterized membrane protein YdjX (TVP38/TMEM64 family)
VNQFVRVTIVILLAASAVAAIIWLPQVNRATMTVLHSVRSAGFWGPLLFIAIYILGCLLYLPGSLLTIGAGFVFGLVLGIVIVSIGSTLGAGAAFLLARTLMRDWVTRVVSHRPEFQAIDSAVAKEGFKVVLLTRLSPILAFNLLNLAFGLTKISFREYLLASWIGMLPGAVLYVYIGTTINNMADLNSGRMAGSPANTALLVLGLVATLVVVVLLARIARKGLRSINSPTAQPG